MACRNAYTAPAVISEAEIEVVQQSISEPVVAKSVERLLFGVDSKIQANDLLQNNIDVFEWIIRNKIYPNFHGRYLTGENSLTKDEIKFIHHKGCRIAPIYKDENAKLTEEQGAIVAKKIDIYALELGIPENTAIFLELEENETVTAEFMKGFAKALILEGFTPAFKASTDAKFAFDREFSRGMQSDKDIFKKCLIWATAPTVEDYNGITTSHLIHPDNWIPFAPSGITRAEIAIWQYGIDCHPIEDDSGKVVTFHLDLVRNVDIILDKMF